MVPQGWRSILMPDTETTRKEAMTLSLALALNALADAALLGGLAWVMSRPAKLTPHVPATAGLALLPAEARPVEQPERIAA